MNSRKREELDKIIKEENLNSEETYKFTKKSFDKGSIELAKDRSRLKKKNVVIDKLIDFFDKFFSITNKSLFTKKEVEYKKMRIMKKIN